MPSVVKFCSACAYVYVNTNLVSDVFREKNVLIFTSSDLRNESLLQIAVMIHRLKLESLISSIKWILLFYLLSLCYKQNHTFALKICYFQSTQMITHMWRKPLKGFPSVSTWKQAYVYISTRPFIFEPERADLFIMLLPQVKRGFKTPMPKAWKNFVGSLDPV